MLIIIYFLLYGTIVVINFEGVQKMNNKKINQNSPDIILRITITSVFILYITLAIYGLKLF